MLSCPRNEAELNELLSIPPPGLIGMMKRLEGDIAILGVAGKMGVTMAMQAKKAVEAAGVSKRIIGVARFSKEEERQKLEECGVETVKCDLLDRDQVNALPDYPNIIFMAGKKFGTDGNEAQTWAMNALAPAFVAGKFRSSRIVVFSTGCVYPLRSAAEGGCTEKDLPSPIGEYSQSCLARERIFEYYQQKYGTKLLIFRLNYSIDLRYGVLHDICRPVWEGKAVSNSVGYFNVIWQGDAQMVQEHKIRKHYTAFIARDPALPDSGTMTDYLFFDKRADKSFPASPSKTSAKKAELTYALFPATDTVTRAEIDMITGRTHQIRVQFASRKSPLIGDRKYGSRIALKAPALFCTGIEFEWKDELCSCSMKPGFDFVQIH